MCLGSKPYPELLGSRVARVECPRFKQLLWLSTLAAPSPGRLQILKNPSRKILEFSCLGYGQRERQPLLRTELQLDDSDLRTSFHGHLKSRLLRVEKGRLRGDVTVQGLMVQALGVPAMLGRHGAPSTCDNVESKDLGNYQYSS